MSRPGSAHDQIVRREFTRQAPAYAALPEFTDPDRIDRMIRAVQPVPEARVSRSASASNRRSRACYPNPIRPPPNWSGDSRP